MTPEIHRILLTNPSMAAGQMLAGSCWAGFLFFMVVTAIILLLSALSRFRGKSPNEELTIAGIIIIVFAGLTLWMSQDDAHNLAIREGQMMDLLRSNFAVTADDADTVRFSRQLSPEKTDTVMGQAVYLPAAYTEGFTLPLAEAKKLTQAMLASTDAALSKNAQRIAVQ
jgi:hypothetical protein